MNKGLLLGGLAAGGLLALAYRERNALSRVAVAAKGKVKTVVREEIKRMATSLIPSKVLDNVAKYHLAKLVEQYRGAVPWAVAMAMMEHESASTCDPSIYNYKTTDAKGNRIFKIAYARPGAGKFGDGWCEFDPWACGLYQIVNGLRKDYPKRDGKAPTTAELFDPVINIQCALAKRSKDATRLLPYAGGDPVLFAMLIYFAHAEGIGKLIGGKYPGAFAKLKAAGKAVTWANLAALPWGATGWWALGNRLAGIAAVGARIAVWQAVQPPGVV